MNRWLSRFFAAFQNHGTGSLFQSFPAPPAEVNYAEVFVSKVFFLERFHFVFLGFTCLFVFSYYTWVFYGFINCIFVKDLCSSCFHT